MQSEQRTGYRGAIDLLIELLRGQRWQYALFCVAVISLGLVTLLPAELFRRFTAGVQSLDEAGVSSLVHTLLIFGGVVAVALFIAAFGTNFVEQWLKLNIEAKLRRRVMARVHRTSLAALDDTQRGDLLTRVTSDLFEVEEFLVGSMPRQLQSLGIAVGSGVFFLIHSGALGLLPLLTALILGRVNLSTQRRLAPVLGELRTLHGSIFQQLIESLEGIRTIRAHSAEQQVERRFEEGLRVVISKTLGMARVLGALLGGSVLASQVLITVCLTLAAFGLARHQLELGAVLVYPFFLGLFYESVQSLSSSAFDWNRFLVEGGRLGELLSVAQAENGAREGDERGTVALLEHPGRVHRLEISDLRFGHEHGVEIGPVTFQLARGRLVAITGPSGCGKSTLLEVVAGLRPWREGRIVAHSEAPGAEPLWDSREACASSAPLGLAALVEQHPYIFEGTLRENLELGQAAPLDDACIQAAIERAGLEKFCEQSGGLDHFLHDRGLNLSEGERYRIALCRSLLAARPVLLLDEPFAALDEASIDLVVHTLNLERQTKAILVVTHQLPRRMLVDEQIAFSGGAWSRAPTLERLLGGRALERSTAHARRGGRNFRGRHPFNRVAFRSDG